MNAAYDAHSASASTPRKVVTQPRYMSIGAVKDQLHREFPDVSLSKIRYLESQGLVSPERTSTGYRRYTSEDVERLRYVLSAQRDNYYPLKVIREQLEAMDSGKLTALGSHGAQVGSLDGARLSDVEVAERAGVELDAVDELCDAGLISPDAAGLFREQDVRVVMACEPLRAFGFDVRHFKSIRNIASRQVDLVSQVAGPIAKSRGDNARVQAQETGRELMGLVVSLHSALVKNALRRELGE